MVERVVGELSRGEVEKREGGWGESEERGSREGRSKVGRKVGKGGLEKGKYGKEWESGVSEGRQAWW